MPAPKKKYYKRQEIQEILDISKSKALDLMHMFAADGKAVVHGYMYRVRVEVFHDWLSSQDGYIEPKRTGVSGAS